MTAPVAGTDHLYYVGRVGYMVALPDRLADVSASRSVIGGVHQSLGGTQTFDMYAVKGTWAWQWDDLLLPHQTAFVKSLVAGLVPGPLRLVNPREANRLPVQVAGGGSQRSSPTGFAVSTGTRVFRALEQCAAPAASLPAAALLKGAVGWTRPAGTGVVSPSWPDTLGRWRLPLVLRDGAVESLTVSMWACASAPTGVRVGWTEDRAATSKTSAESVALQASRGVVVGPDKWQIVRATVKPKPAAVAITPALVVDDLQAGSTDFTPASTVFTTAWQVAAVGAESLPPLLHACDLGDPGQGWRPGGGAPEVLVAGGDSKYGLPWFQGLGLALVEA